MQLDAAQRTELRGQIWWVLLAFCGGLLLLLSVSATLRLSIIVLAGFLLISGFQLYVSTKYGISGPSAYARMLVSRHLTLLTRVLEYEPNLVWRLELRPQDVSLLSAAPEENRRIAARHFSRAGYPRRNPVQLTLFTLSMSMFMAGLVGGVVLPEFAQDEFRVLCGARMQEILTPHPLVLIYAAGVLGAAGWAKAVNARNLRAESAVFARDPVAALNRLTGAHGEPWRHALRADLSRAARLVDVSEEEADDLLSLPSLDLSKPESWYSRIRWSSEIDLVIAQVQLVLGLYLGLVLPPLLGISC
jgi:hypothetical protein